MAADESALPQYINDCPYTANYNTYLRDAAVGYTRFRNANRVILEVVVNLYVAHAIGFQLALMYAFFEIPVEMKLLCLFASDIKVPASQ